jgi:ATP-dependent RNA helicase RhlB
VPGEHERYNRRQMIFEDHLSDLFFADLPLPHPVRAGIAACGFTRATPVQAATLPLLLQGRDVAAQAQTGTGKTAAYLISVFTKLAAPPPRPRPVMAPRALVIAPTRELAYQIQADAVALGHFLAPRIVTVFGGIDYAKQRDQLRAGCDLLIGTPGRLIDYEDQHATTFAYIESLVIDEADRLFDLGFIKDLRRILRLCPPPQHRQSVLLSATLSYRVMELAYEHMNDAQKVEIHPERVTADRVEQSLFHVAGWEKLPLLAGLLKREGFAQREEVSASAGPPSRAMLFVNTKRFADHLVTTLKRLGFRADGLSGDMHQTKRLKILSEFKAGKLPILVATDVASRGLHIDGVTHVFNVDLPQDSEDYVHRIGRTARAGHSGKAISLACENFVLSLDAIQKLIGFKIPVEHADEKLFVSLNPRSGPVVSVTSGGSRHIAPQDEIEEEPAPPPPPPKLVPAKRVFARPVEAKQVIVVQEDLEPEPLEDGPPPTGPDGEQPDFWIREAFGLEEPLPVGAVAVSPSAPGPARKGRPRRRKRSKGPARPVPAPETA